MTNGAFDPQGPIAQDIADLWWLMLALGAAVFVVFAVVLGIGLARGEASNEPEAPGRPNRLVVVFGVGMTSVVLLVVLGATLATMRTVPGRGAPEDALVIEVVGYQYWWEFRYPDHDVVTANEVHLPVGRPVELRLTSADVIHSFWIPELGGKLDLLPNDINTLVLEADEPGEHFSICAEFCGLQHAKMGFVAVVQPAADFVTWLEEQARPATVPSEARAVRGEQVFADAGCASCHRVRGRGAGVDPGAEVKAPDLTHLASRSTLGAATVANRSAELRAWVADPHTVKEGIAMPATDLAPDDLDAVVAYLEGLR